MFCDKLTEKAIVLSDNPLANKKWKYSRHKKE